MDIPTWIIASGSVVSTILSISFILGKQFEKVWKQFEKIDQRFEKIDKRFDKVDEELKEVRKDIGSLDKRITRLEDRLEFSNKIVYVQQENIKEG